MISVDVTSTGERVLVSGLTHAAAIMPNTVRGALTKVAIGVCRAAMDNLNGSVSSAAGSYPPVPVRTGNLKRLTWFLKPQSTSGRNFSGDADSTFSSPPFGIIVYNTAEYSKAIHDGTGSSARFGPRKFLTDALNTFNQGNQIANIINSDVNAELLRRGLSL